MTRSQRKRTPVEPAPEGFDGEYAEEVTNSSYKELEILAFWALGHGPQLFVIGGWAAWHYHRGLGSRDIDVIFLDKGVLSRFLGAYYAANGYEAYGGLLNRRYRKRLSVNGRDVFVEIDAASIEEGPPFHEDRNRTIPYTELENHHVDWRVGPETVRIPTPELLLLQKVKALRDRSWDLDHAALGGVEVAFLQSKIWKDKYDILNLAPFIRHWGTVWDICDKHHCRNLVAETFRNLGLGGSE